MGAVCVVASREDNGPFLKGTLDGELFGGVVYRKKGWFVWDRAPILAVGPSRFSVGGRSSRGPCGSASFLQSDSH